MNPPIPAPLFAVLLFLGMLILLETGRRVGVRRRSRESEGERGSLGTIEGAIFALFGLLMAFTFSGAASRFNEKRMLIAEEEIWGEAVAATRLPGSHPPPPAPWHRLVPPPVCGSNAARAS
jgi:hypothetical protein